ncbi:MAG: PilZ domain-containing protein [Spirochaetota bacterium]
MNERRRSPRFRIGQLIEVSFGREYFLQAAGINISEHGLLVETADAPAPGTRVFIMLEVRHPHGPRKLDGSPESIQLEGFVCRTEDADGGYLVGIEFGDIPDPETRRALDLIIESVKED